MPCFHPLRAYYTDHTNPSTGKRYLTFDHHNQAQGYSHLTLPCGRCIGCRLERSRQWAIRCMHEASLHEHNAFVTLTYNDEHLATLPGADEGHPSLYPSHFTNFMKRLRHSRGPGVRFFHCGEYGDKTNRPHHHALLFNCSFPDKLPTTLPGNTNYRTYISADLTQLWGHGHTYLSDVTFESASYVARYSLKKVYGEGADDWYMGRRPEYLTMSRRPGIATDYFNKFYREIYMRDSCILNGREVKPPKFYDLKYEKMNPAAAAAVMYHREQQAKQNPDNTPQRRLTKERIARHNARKARERAKQ